VAWEEDGKETSSEEKERERECARIRKCRRVCPVMSQASPPLRFQGPNPLSVKKTAKKKDGTVAKKTQDKVWDSSLCRNLVRQWLMFQVQRAGGRREDREQQAPTAQEELWRDSF
jgi:hypothetical protein